MRLPSLNPIVTALLPIPALVCTIANPVLAKTPNEIAQIAIPLTVQINSIAGGGSGVIINQKNEGDKFIYTVLTANHVVKSAAIQYTVRSYIGQNYPVESVEHLQVKDTDPDLALVTFSSPHQYPAISIGDSDQVKIGDKISIFAYPYLDETQSPDERLFVYSSGDINTINAKRPNGYDLLYDATTQKGMSGGPVFNDKGQLIGIHGRGERVANEDDSAKYAFNAAIPINTFLTIEPEFKPNQQPVELAATPKDELDDLLSDLQPIKNISQTQDRYAGASEFYCNLSGSFPRTMARNVVNNQEKVLINWVGNEDDNKDWGLTSTERCQIVSNKFQQAYYENRLEILTNGKVNNLPVICGISDMLSQECNSDNMLLTLRPETNGGEWLNKFLQGEPLKVRGKVFIDMVSTLSTLKE